MSKRIVIDPGHAPGNVNKGPTGYYEYAGMWKLSNYLKTALERRGFDVKLTRAENEDPSTTVRGNASASADLFISEHSNAFNGEARGVEVYYSVQLPCDKPFATAMSKAVSALMGNPDRGAKTRESETTKGKDYYGVMKSARGVCCPHVLLIESGFHDNAEDEKFLKVDDNLKAIAETQAKVICEFFSVEYIKESDTVIPITDDDAISKHPIMGDSVLTSDELARYLLSKNPNPRLNCTAFELAHYYIEEGKAEGVRGDVAFCQAILETGWMGFNGTTVKPEQNNFCGLGTTGPDNPGHSFETPEYGVRAHIQHLKAYSSCEPLNLSCIDPRFGKVTRGIAQCFEDLNGRWAVPGDGYGEYIVRLYEAALKEAVKDANEVPAELPVKDMLTKLMDGSSINTPERWIDGLESIPYFDWFVKALYGKYEM